MPRVGRVRQGDNPAATPILQCRDDEQPARHGHPTATRALERQRPPDCTGRRVKRCDPGLPATRVHRLAGNHGDHLALAREFRRPLLLPCSQVYCLNGRVFHVAPSDHPVIRNGECAEASAACRLPAPSLRAVGREPENEVVAPDVVTSGGNEAILDDRRRENASRIEIQAPLLVAVIHRQGRERARALTADVGD